MVYTWVEEAKAYVAQTGVDLLAVSIGTVHGRMKGEPVLDVERLQQINEALNIPLVIHGGTGLSDKQFNRLIENGVAKINYYTALADAAGKRIRNNVANDEQCGYTGIVNGIQDEMRTKIERCMVIWGSTGQADAVLAFAEPWLPVHHVIIYNVDTDDAQLVNNMMREGERVLSKIPGVRCVITGKAVQEDAKYKFSWLVQFVHQNVIDSYRVHPDHVAFADKHFRPVAGDRISIDYCENYFPR